MTKISVIVPIYKVEKYLARCVDSIINQTYKNLEIILVDDGSPDGCGAMCDEYAKKDERIKVIHKENGGLSSARNAGLDIATGDYIAFVDSDDRLSSDAYEKPVCDDLTLSCICAYRNALEFSVLIELKDRICNLLLLCRSTACYRYEHCDKTKKYSFHDYGY